MLQKLKKPIIDIIVLTIAIISSFHLGMYHNKLKSSDIVQKSSFTKTKNLQSNTIAVTNRGELLILDRTTGVYEVYDESIGMSIFKLYASKISSK